ncbi:GNAT family N-acetyltransferase [Aliikangiella sp. IMCC44359]|uniref:GNAT family N-acetyltransferase n=1 Tax=Aliikangiella sp. IMCC44359 TaxID=3459125 RepID=UPI00403AAEC0
MITLRTFTETDIDFLKQVYGASRERELGVLNWSKQQKDDFIQMQFNAQHHYYQQHYNEAEYSIITKDGIDIGRLYLDRRNDEFRIVDIALLPEYCNQGTGSYLLEKIFDEARELKLPVRVHVENFNPARRLYERLGFKPIKEGDVYLLMEWNN